MKMSVFEDKKRVRSGRKFLQAALVRAAVLGLVLVGLVLLMRFVTSSSFQEGLGMLFGEARVWDWCPPGVSSIDFLGDEPRSVIDPVEIGRLCRASFEPVEAEIVARSDFRSLAVGKNSDGTEVMLEGDLSRGVFRVKAMPFRSGSLERALATPRP